MIRMSRYIRTLIILLAAVQTVGTMKAQNAAQSTGPTIRGNVYGGGNLAEVQGSVTVNVKGGTVVNDVYGGGALASTNTANWDAKLNDGAGGWAAGKTSASNTTIVNLTGGVVGNAYGGGLGDANTPAYVWGDVTVAVNGTMFTQTYQEYKNADESNIPKTGQVFGCNNINGSPKGNVTVHVFKTVVRNNEGTVEDKPTRKSGIYELLAVYGGGNLAPYEPVKANSESTDDDNTTTYDDNISSTNVIVDGCDLTSIKQVYGGGNAASTPSTKVTINGSYEIDEVFGGGNGKDNISATLENPGAHIGFRAYTDGNDTEKASAKYGRGVGRVNINGGIIHTVYGGSNTKGNVRRVAVAMLDKTSDESCFSVDEAYGGGKSAEMDGKAMLSLGCIPGVGTVYGGARAAKVNNDVVLTITNGTFTNVFGGNNEAGEIKGSITVNIEETGCRPIHITNLYGCGNQAPYATPEGKDDPTINILSCTSIDNVYGGGYGSTAVVTGNTQVNINMVKGRWSQANSPAETNPYNETGAVKLGTIGHVYGGGYGADVKGNTYVNVGTASTVRFTSLADNAETTEVDERVKNVEGANITGDVFGGGFGEETNVTGTAYVNVGEKRTTTTPADPANPESQESTSVSYVAHDATETGNFGAGSGIYGGSALGTVNKTEVNLYAGKIAAEVFGGGQGRVASGTEGQDGYVDAKSATITTKATVTLYKADVASAIYGGCNVNGSAAVTEVNILGGTLGVAPDPNATSTAVAEVLFGGGKGQLTTTGTAVVNIGKATTADGDSPSTTYEGAATIYGNMYGGSALGAVGVSSSNEPTGSATVNLYKATSVTGDVFGDGMGSVTGAGVTARMGSSTVNLEGLDLTGNIYGGCNYNGIVYGTSTVNLKSGSSKDVFGGGQGELTYVKGNVLVSVGVGETGGTKEGLTINGDVYGGSAKGHVNAMPNTAQDATLPIIPQTTATTTVNLLSGLIKGDAYGGGLGQKAGFNGASADVPAYVGGDIFVNLNGTAFDIGYTSEEGSGGQVDKSGRVFGANNLCGSPQGNVTVTVNKTVEGNTQRSPTAKKTNENATFHVAAVYGGGNLADYTTTGKKANVVIKGCEESSIRYVYGGGNAAAVPETDVQIEGAYEIGYVFGGGNGKDKYKNDTGWQTNPGANVNGNVKTTLMGGVIHEAYGGSNEKGRIGGSVSINTATIAGCTLDVAKVYGAGRNADIDGDLVMVMGCMPGDDNPTNEVYGGAENANVKGNVELTITSGSFGKVFGGNNQSGAIFGHIIVNIEETGCRPIKIDELYLGGNEAAYSVYGYKNTGTADEPVYVARTSKDDDTAVTFDFNGHTVPDATTGQYDDPVLNVISCTRIGKVFGGGLGTGATLYGNPKVNINMIKGAFGDSAPASGNPDKLGAIGTVYGGGNEANVEGNTTVNVGTEKTVTLKSAADDESTTDVDERVKPVLGAYIAGNVFGGGKGVANMTPGTDGEAFLCAKAMVKGDKGTQVNIGNGFVRGNVYGGGEVGRVEHNTAVTIGLESGASTPVVNGNVFGAGAGTNTHGYSALVRGNSTVIVQADSKVLGSVYGGGEKATVGKYRVVDGLPVALEPDNEHPNSGYCYVTIRGNAEIGPDDMEMTKAGGPSDAGHVFGAGKGVLPYEGYAANEKPQHMNGKQHLVDGAWDNKSWDDELKDYPAYSSSQAALDADYVKFIKSLALATQTVVTIEGNAFVKGSVYGGSENGYVQQNTKVNIQGDCQIGNGYVQMDDNGNYLNKLATPLIPLAVNRRYTPAEWEQGKLILGSDDRQELRTLVGSTNYQKSLPECASWPYGQAADLADRYAPYDREANTTGNLGQYADGSTTEGGRAVGDDGHTFYGNVFGGGSGYYPYKPGRWFWDAGAVYGNTEVNITGGHILTNIYGGNELTNVSGTCTVNFGGTATLGVPRTLKQIDAHPVTCYLFGAGKGDQRVFFNKSTNVENVVVNITGGRIYGSVFGGGEDGHVLRNVTMTIGNDGGAGPTIGTWGTSYVDGNVFGGGRGFGGDAYTAGNVAGSVKMEIKGGTMLGSIYGGGRLGSVGYGLFDSSDSNYGEMRPDNEGEEGFTDGTSNFFTKGRGHIDITISGGTIGNTHEYIMPNNSNIPTGLPATISDWTTENWNTWKAHNHISKTEFDTATGRLTHTKGGNVFTGGMGRQTQLDGTTPITAIDWTRLGAAKQTKLTIKGDAVIKSNVYGGGELGAVISASGNTSEGGTTEIDIQGGTIGQLVGTGTAQYTFGSVYGGGMGSENDTSTEEKIGGRVAGSTKITMSAGAVKGSVYGGGELAIVQGSHTTSDSKTVGTEINIIGGSIGYNQDGFGGATMGNVYGGGKGSLDTKQAGLIKTNTLIKISGGNIYHNIYGGGAYGSVGTFNYATPAGSTQPSSTPSGCTAGTGTAWINITGGTLGINGHENGMVFGSSRGDVAIPDASGEDPNNKLAWVDNTDVTIGASPGTNTTPWIKGSVYGSGENGHVLHDTYVAIHDGKIGIEAADGISFTSNGKTYTGAEYGSRGNVYGGGCGTDTYAVTEGTGTEAVTKHYFNRSSGIVRGNATVTMDGGHVVRNVYGGGAMGSVGLFTRKSDGTAPHIPGVVESCATNTGLCTVTIRGGTVGPKNDAMSDDVGNVFGASRGEVHDASLYPNLDRMVFVDNTVLSISNAATVKGSAYGGSEAGHVLTATQVNMSGGTVGRNVYGGGNLGDVGLYTTDAGGSNIYAAGKGICQVSISGGIVGPENNTNSKIGNVFGAGKGEGTTFTCEKAMVNTTTVSIEGGTVNGNVYGGGEVGRVESNTTVTVGSATGTGSLVVKGSVFGAGAGLETHGYSALVRGNTAVTVQGNAHVEKNVYGGGETASVGRYGLDAEKMPSILLGGGECAVTIGGNATIGVAGNDATGNVFGACKGVTPHFDKANNDKSLRSRRMTMYDAAEFPEADKGTTWEYYEAGSPYVWEYYQDETSYTKYLETLALATRPTVIIKEDATVYGSVYGGGEMGITKGTVVVNIQGGTIAKDVYGGGALANTNTTKLVGEFDNGIPRKDTEGNYVTTEVHPTTTVNLTGGSFRDAYGGGLGQLASGTQKAIPATVGGDVTVTLNGSKVNGNIFGANNINGTPHGHVLVHVKKTIRREGHTFDVDAVFGGGNNADYVPTDTKQYSEVIIEGCGLTSINQVYGGGNAAATPGTSILVKGTKIIHELFGGGNGERGAAYAANVGYHFDGTNRTDYARGDGKALVQLMAGKIDFVYGGSNSNGDIRGGSTTSNIPITGTSPECCSDLQVGRIFGGGKNADMASGSDIVIECQTNSSWIEEIYAGAENANVGGNVRLTITSGKFGRVFGGNKSGGRLNGSITVNIEESPSCGIPVIIGELYAGGNKAPYSIYGYDDGGTMLTSGVAKHASPVVNVRAFTSIGNIFGGGYGEDAVMYGSPTININEVEVDHTDKSNAEFQGNLYRGETKTIVVDPGETPYDVVLYPHEDGKMGVIGNVYGGGNAAKVYGDTNVNIGTKTTDVFHTPLKKTVHNSQTGVDEEVATDEADRTHTVKGADIRGNVYGGGNEAEVTGDTNVKIGITATP